MACATSLGLILLVLILALSLTAFRPGKNQYYEISFQVVISQCSQNAWHCYAFLLVRGIQALSWPLLLLTWIADMFHARLEPPLM